MEKIIWGETLSVGVRVLDDQHKQIVTMINSLIEMSGVNIDSEIITDALTKMTMFSVEHFKKEEQYMLDYAYPEYEAQRKQHQEFKKKTVNFCKDTMARKENVPAEIFAYLKSWWLDHILQEDMKYKKYFNDRGLK